MTRTLLLRGSLSLAIATLSLAVALGAERPGDFEEYRDALVRAFGAKDSDAALELLERGRDHDNLEHARILTRHGLQNDSLLVHREAMNLLSRMKDAEARQHVIELAKESKRWEIRAHCSRIMARYGGEFVFERLGKGLEDKKWQVRSAVIRSLHRFRRTQTIDLLIPRLKDEKGRILTDISWTLRQLTGMSLDAVFEDWNGWWQSKRDGYEMPRAAEVKEMLSEEKEEQPLKTAVRKGLYGPIYSEKVAFLLDVSGSMGAGTDEGTRLEIAVRELSRVLEAQITDDTYFNVIPFAEEVHPFSTKLKRAKKKLIGQTLKKLPKLRSGGETNAHGALKAAFADPNVDTIYLLSDGSPTVGEEFIPDLIRLQVEEWNRDRRVIINCIGFFPGTAKNQDKAEARDFLRNLARENEGFYKEIY